MNEITTIETYEQGQAQVSLYTDVNLFQQFYKMAESLSKTELVPQNYRNKPESCLLAIDIARQVGCKSPFYIMQNLHMIQGKPSWSGQYSAAVVRANFKEVRLEWKGKDDEDGCGCRVVAKDSNGNECIGTWVTMKMAKAEGWVDKAGSKWKTMPLQMLQYRAFAFFARVNCPEKLLGVGDEFDKDYSEPNKSRTSKTIELEKMLMEENNND